MKKISLVIICFVLFCVMSNAVSAVTVIAGKIYEQDMETPVEGADVEVVCYHNEDENVQNFTSLNDGIYAVQYSEHKCNGGDTVIVTATKDGASGSNSGVVRDDLIGTIDLAIVNVAIPEFVTITAGLALGGAGLSYFKLRKKY